MEGSSEYRLELEEMKRIGVYDIRLSVAEVCLLSACMDMFNP